ncbi:MAG: metal ABC transporter permease [Phycisphaerae bacterium]|nr:metal ABC transporter permease [Phycisphaerae bacterium]
MERLSESLPLLVLPFAACVVIASLHCYMGLHVIKRGVIFVDLALAQCAALGAAVALFALPHVCDEPGHHPGHEAISAVTTEAQLAEQLDLEDSDNGEPLQPAPHGSEASHNDAHTDAHHAGHPWFTYATSVFFAMLGAVVLSLTRLRDDRIPHEAIIGIIFVVSAALTVLILSKAPHGHEKMEAMLIGSILFVSRERVTQMLLLYVALGVFHFVFRERFISISKDIAAADHAGRRVRLWDCLFYGSFALMVTQSVSIGGVFVVFSFLIIPAACAALFTDRFGTQLVIAWLVALFTALAGLFLSAVGDMPTGSSLVSCFGAVLAVCAVLSTPLRRKRKGAF